MMQNLRTRGALRRRTPLVVVTVCVLSTRSARSQSADETLPEPEKAVFHQDVAWSPDGEWIAFSEYSGGEEYSPSNWGVHVVRADGSLRRLIVENAIYVTWSPDGKKLAFGSKRNGAGDIYSINLDGSGLRRLTDHEAKDIAPAWSPKGDKIAFCSTRSGDEDIYIMDADGSHIVRLTDDAGKDYNPAWSPDGGRLVFYRERGDRKDQIWMINADGTGERNITNDDRHSVFPAFVPDGDVAFTCTDGDATGTVRLDPESGERTVMAKVRGFFVRWSPNGKQVAFIAGRWPQSAVYVANADGSSVRKVVN